LNWYLSSEKYSLGDGSFLGLKTCLYWGGLIKSGSMISAFKLRVVSGLRVRARFGLLPSLAHFFDA
jgi:hypothetical protein